MHVSSMVLANLSANTIDDTWEYLLFCLAIPASAVTLFGGVGKHNRLKTRSHKEHQFKNNSEHLLQLITDPLPK